MAEQKYSRLPNESDEELIYRICALKGADGIETWEKCADVLNELTNQEYTSSKYRKQYQSFVKMFDANASRFSQSDDAVAELKVERYELEKERQKVSDERTELRRLIREASRRESYVDLVKRVMSETVEPIKFDEYNCVYGNESDLIVHLTDLHTGIEIDNFTNKFNEDVLVERVAKFTNKIISVADRHNSTNCHIIIGELVSGIIHNSLRIENNLDLMEQFKLASEVISSMVLKLTPHFNEIHIYVTEGNHSRIFQNKEDSLVGENMDVLLPWYLKARMQNFTSVKVHDNDFVKDIAMFKVRNELVMASHGDKDSPNSVVQNYTLLFGQQPDLIYLGHRHTNGLVTAYDTKIIQSGCVSGTDSYALSKRLNNRPEQTISVITDDGLDCIYDVKLD